MMKFVIICLYSVISYQDKTDQEKVKRLLQELNDDDPIKRDDTASKLIEMWESDSALKMIEQTSNKVKSEEVKQRCKQIIDEISFRRTLGKDAIQQLDPSDLNDFYENYWMRGTPSLEHLKKWIEKKDNIKPKKKLSEVLAYRVASCLQRAEDKTNLIEFIRNNSIEECASSIAKLLKDPDIYDQSPDRKTLVRESAINALCKLKAKTFAKEISVLLVDSDSGVVGYAIQALGILEAKEYTKEILELLESESSWVRASAIVALGNLNSRESIDCVAKLLKDSKIANPPNRNMQSETGHPVRKHVIDFLVKFEGKKFAKNFVALLRDDHYSVRRGAIEALVSLQIIEYSTELLKLLKDISYCERREALIGLCKLCGCKYVKEIAELLDDKDVFVKGDSARVLGHLQAKDYTMEVKELLKAEDSWIKSSAAWALGELKANEYKKEILELLNDNGEHANFAKGSALIALMKLGAKEYIEEITKLCDDSSRCWDIVSWDSVKESTVGTIAKQVLKTWGINLENK